MKSHNFKTAFYLTLSIFKYIFILGSLVFWIYLVIDDWNLFNKEIVGDWFKMIKGWGLWYVVYAITFIIYYWLFAITIILIYQMVSKLTNKK